MTTNKWKIQYDHIWNDVTVRDCLQSRQYQIVNTKGFICINCWTFLRISPLNRSQLRGWTTVWMPRAVAPQMTPRNIQLCVTVDWNYSSSLKKTAATLMLWLTLSTCDATAKSDGAPTEVKTSMHCVAITGDLFCTKQAKTSLHSSCWCNLDQPPYLSHRLLVHGLSFTFIDLLKQRYVTFKAILEIVDCWVSSLSVFGDLGMRFNNQLFLRRFHITVCQEWIVPVFRFF